MDPVAPVRPSGADRNRNFVDVAKTKPRNTVRPQQLLDGSKRTVKQFAKEVVAAVPRGFDGETVRSQRHNLGAIPHGDSRQILLADIRRRHSCGTESNLDGLLFATFDHPITAESIPNCAVHSRTEWSACTVREPDFHCNEGERSVWVDLTCAHETVIPEVKLKSTSLLAVR
jgi:hypothetical protein